MDYFEFKHTTLKDDVYCIRIEQNIRSLFANNKIDKRFYRDDIMSIYINNIQM